MPEKEFRKQFYSLVEEFQKVVKRVLVNRPLSTKEAKILEYKTLLCLKYNNLVTFSEQQHDSLSDSILKEVSLRINKCKASLVKCSNRLDYSFKFFQHSAIVSEPKTDDSDSEFSDANSEIPMINKTRSLPEDLNSLKSKALDYTFFKGNFSLSASSILLPENQVVKEENTMATAEQKRTFISLCASIVRNNYDGNPLGLESFIDKVNLIEELSDENLASTLVRFIISKLEGKARESVPTGVMSLKEIKESLRNRIKPDNSKVVAGKIVSLKVINGDYSEFSKKVEELADSLQRSLIVEGVTHAKAHEMAIEQTVTVCRANAKTELVKSILASSSFTDPKDVVAKMVIEQSNEVAEKNVLRFNSTFNNSQFPNNSTRNHATYRSNSSHSYRNYNDNRRFRNNQDNQRNNNFRNNRSDNYQNRRHNNVNNNNTDYYNRNNNYSANNYRQNSNRGSQRDNNNSNPRVRSLNVESHQEETELSTNK